MIEAPTTQLQMLSGPAISSVKSAEQPARADHARGAGEKQADNAGVSPELPPMLDSNDLCHFFSPIFTPLSFELVVTTTGGCPKRSYVIKIFTTTATVKPHSAPDRADTLTSDY